MSKLLIVGCGYLGKQVVTSWIESNGEVAALTRSNASATALLNLGIEPIVHDWYREDGWPQIDGFQSVLICPSHAAIEGIDASETHVRGLRNLLPKINDAERIVYLSTTGVFAFVDDGRWLDETSPVAPNRSGSIAALSAEEWLSKQVTHDKLTILRAAGIYGPHRIPNIESLRRGEPILQSPTSYLNLIHVEDLAAFCCEALSSTNLRSGLFCVSDGKPPRRQEYYEFIADQIAAPRPRFALQNDEISRGPSIVGKSLAESVEPNAPSSMRRRGEGSKRISNQRLLETFDHSLQIPDFRSGLKPLLTVARS